MHMLHGRLISRCKARISLRTRRLRGIAQPPRTSSTERRPALPARPMIGLVGVVPRPVGPVAVLAPGDMRRAAAAIVPAGLRIVPVGRYAQAEIESRINVPT